MSEVRRAVAGGNARDIREAVTSVEIETALQQVGSGLLKAYRTADRPEREPLSPVLISVSQHLQLRGWVGDDILASEMLAELRGEQQNSRPLRIDLDELSSTMADHGEYPSGYLNTQTGQVVPAVLTDEYAVGDEEAVDVEGGNWVYLVDDSQQGWQDMADFAAEVEDPRIREILEEAVHGKGAFSRFRSAVHRADLGAEWYCFADDRRWCRARQELAELGLRSV
jgi:hypothetical protein